MYFIIVIIVVRSAAAQLNFIGVHTRYLNALVQIASLLLIAQTIAGRPLAEGKHYWGRCS